MQGWIKLHRKMLDNPIVCKDGDHLAVWIYLLLNATHENYPALFKGEKITLAPGQLITGRKSISEKLSISESKTKRVLIALENDQQIDRQRSSQNSLITILNWDKYQECDQQKGQQMDSQRPASDQPVTTNKNVKNIRNNIPPNMDDVIAYCTQRDKGVDPYKWFDFYSAKDWMVGKNKMVDWQSAVRTWEKKEDKPKSTTREVKVPEGW